MVVELQRRGHYGNGVIDVENYGGGGINDVKTLQRWRDHGCCGIVQLVNYTDVELKKVENLWKQYNYEQV